MKILLLIATLSLAAPAFAATSEPSAPPAQDAKKADPGKPFVYDANRRPIPSKPAPKKAVGPGIG
jgi:hypothetical protein